MTRRPIYGGDTSLNDPQARVRGVYAEHPAGTPKYNPGNTTAAAQQTQARLYIEVPDDETAAAIVASMPTDEAKAYAQAVLQVTGADSRRVYLDFLLQNIQESSQEKVQVSEVLSDAYVAFFFGRKARMYSFQGALLNTVQDNWYDAWHILYNNVLRGTRLADIGFPVTIAYDWRRITGYLVGNTTSLDGNMETSVSLGFQVLVKDVGIFRASDAPGPTFALANDDPSQIFIEAGAAVSIVTPAEAARMTVHSSLAQASAVTTTVATAIDSVNAAIRAGSAVVTASESGDSSTLDFKQGNIPLSGEAI
jgi:hypothetical protein